MSENIPRPGKSAKPSLRIVPAKKKRSGRARGRAKKATANGWENGSGVPRKPRHNRKEAERRLGIDPKELEQAPPLSQLLHEAAGGLQTVLLALRFSVDPQVKLFLEKYDSLSLHDQRVLTWEAVALAAGVAPPYLLGAALFALQQHSANRVKILALSSHPEVMQRRIQYALRPNGEKDRSAIQTALGFLPSHKGSTFIINPLQELPKPGEDEDEDDEEGRSDQLARIFPELTVTQEKLLPVRARRLDPGD